MEKKSKILATNPLDEDEVLAQTFYLPSHRSEAEKQPTQEAKPKPQHYKVCCISLYTEDIERLEGMVQELKRRGHTKANKSQLIRFALRTVDLDAMPKEI